MSTDNGMAVRVIALGCAVWTILFSIPNFLNVPGAEPTAGRKRVGFFACSEVLGKNIARLFRQSPPTFWFLLFSAVYSDGMAGVFAFGAIIAAVTFQFTSNKVLIFGVVTNRIASITTIIAERFDDITGPRAVILFGLVVAGLATFFLHNAGKTMFGVCGLLLTVFVGPAQAAGRESEIFGF